MREHATTWGDQTPGPRPVTLSSDGRPLLAVSGSSWEPAEVSSQVPWIVCGRLPLRTGGPGPVRASVHLSRVLVEAGVTPAVHLHEPAPSVERTHHNPYSAGWHINVVPRATEVAVRAVLVCSGSLGGRSDDSVSTARCPGPWALAARSPNGGTVPDATGITPVESTEKDIEQAGGRSPHKQEMEILQLAIRRPSQLSLFTRSNSACSKGCSNENCTFQ